MPQYSKKHQVALNMIEKSKLYSPHEAIELSKRLSYAKFDETLEIHMNTSLDPRKADQQLRGVILFPHGLGKKARILVFAQGDVVRVAEGAGADYVGGDELVKKIEEGWLDFDVALATPDMMSKVGKLGKILGRRGLMPNPKSGTVVAAADIPRVVDEARKGRAEFKLDRSANVHLPLGKVSFEAETLLENLAAVIEVIVRSKPSGAKGQYIKNASLATSMGPGIRLDLRSTLTLTTG